MCRRFGSNNEGAREDCNSLVDWPASPRVLVECASGGPHRIPDIWSQTHPLPTRSSPPSRARSVLSELLDAFRDWNAGVGGG
jgi:hypothetical protein